MLLREKMGSIFFESGEILVRKPSLVTGYLMVPQ